MTKIKPGDWVYCDYRGEHMGEVLRFDDPRAWAGTLAFPEDEPDPIKVREHVAKCATLLDDGKRPVLWSTFEKPRVLWDTNLRRV